jgi:hypothetical protein
MLLALLERLLHLQYRLDTGMFVRRRGDKGEEGMGAGAVGVAAIAVGAWVVVAVGGAAIGIAGVAAVAMGVTAGVGFRTRRAPGPITSSRSW